MVFSKRPPSKMTHGEEKRAVELQVSPQTLTLPPLLSLRHGDLLLALPSHLLEEILFRLPVKHLLPLRCVCKPLNSLISDPKFARKHLRLSTKRCQLYTVSLCGNSSKYFIISHPIHPIVTTMTNNLTDITDYLECPQFHRDMVFPIDIVGSCDGILCLVDNGTNFILLCNPSIRKFNVLPPLEYPHGASHINNVAYGFGHDPVSDNYKVVVVNGTEVNVHTLGSDSWRRIGDFPFVSADRFRRFESGRNGRFVNGTINWLAFDETNRNFQCVVVSLDLGKELFQEVLQPDYGRVVDSDRLILSVTNDCLCMLADHDVWIMKEYGNRDSWTKLMTIPDLNHPGTSYGFTKVLYISKAKVVLELDAYGLEARLVVYDSINGVAGYHMIWNPLELSVESLISPCS